MTSRIKAAVDLAATVAMLGAAVFLVVVNWPTTRPALKVPVEPLSIPAAPAANVIGSREALVVLIEYSDFRCPVCVQFANDIFPALRVSYIDTGRVSFVFRHFPVTSRKPDAEEMAAAASCAAAQGRFGSFHDWLFSPKVKFDPAAIAVESEILGLDAAAFETCRLTAGRDAVRVDVAAGRKLGVDSTPSFFVGTMQPDGRVKAKHALRGLVAIEKFESVLDELLKAAADR